MPDENQDFLKFKPKKEEVVESLMDNEPKNVNTSGLLGKPVVKENQLGPKKFKDTV